MDDRYRLANARHQAARLELARGRQREALRCLFESASMFNAQGGLGQASLVLQQAARLVFKLGDPRAAARLLAAASVERGPAVIQMFMPDELAAVEGLRAQLNEQLGEAAQARLAEEGRRWTLAQALASVQACLAVAVPAA
jgi:hypothetical protein